MKNSSNSTPAASAEQSQALDAALARPQQSQALDVALTRALETPPELSIPDGFAARVLARIPPGDLSPSPAIGPTQAAFQAAAHPGSQPGSQPTPQPVSRHPAWPLQWPTAWPTSISRPSTGRRAALAALALLFALFILPPMLIPHSAAAHPIASLAIWGTFAAEFIVLTVWISLRPDTLG